VRAWSPLRSPLRSPRRFGQGPARGAKAARASASRRGTYSTGRSRWPIASGTHEFRRTGAALLHQVAIVAPRPGLPRTRREASPGTTSQVTSPCSSGVVADHERRPPDAGHAPAPAASAADRRLARGQPITSEDGRPPRGTPLPASTRLGRVRLQVADLERSLAFYQDLLGLHLAARERGRSSLAAARDAAVLVELHERVGARPAGRPARLGLYHVALLLPAPAELGRLVRHLGAAGVRFGAADHLVSQAIYLSDPDGLGLEVYADRPRDRWRRRGRELVMVSDPLDIDALLRAAGRHDWDGMPDGTTIGHLHLHVAELTRAAAFYGDTIGFHATVWSYPGALFLAAGGYHHHLGLNTWAGAGARPPDDDDARLLEWSIDLPSTDDLEPIVRALTAAGHPPERNGAAVTTADPWGTAVRLQVGRERR
jgi:catechol 2,3-dioxygenase